MDVQKVASLARLKVSEDEAKAFKQQMESILKYFEELSVVDTEGVEPMVTPTEIELIFREDVAKTTVSVEEALSNAPEKQGHLFKVPPVV